MTMTHVDCFTSLDAVPKKKQGDMATVLRVLHKVGRFSIWDATENDRIASTMTLIVQGGYIEPDPVTPFPWTKAILTPKGLAAAGLSPKEPRHD